MTAMDKLPETSNDSGAERRRIQKGRNLVLALLLAGFVALVYAISIVKLG